MFVSAREKGREERRYEKQRDWKGGKLAMFIDTRGEGRESAM